MPIASFSKKVFQVSSNRKYTLNGLGWSGNLETEAQEKLKDKPSTFIKGKSLTTLSGEVPLRADFGINVRSEIEQWEAIRDKAIPDFFILGTKPLCKNKMLLKSVDVSDTQVDGKGRLLKATIKLEFQEYVRAGKAKPKETSASPGTGAPSSQKPASYLSNPPNKEEQKRTNISKEEALERIARIDRLYNEGARI